MTKTTTSAAKGFVPSERDRRPRRSSQLPWLSTQRRLSGTANAVLQGGRDGRLRLPRDHRLHVLFAVAQHAQRGHDLRMLLEVRPCLVNRALGGLVDAHPEAKDQILSELELSTMAARRRLIVAEPALDELLGGRGHDAFDA